MEWCDVCAPSEDAEDEDKNLCSAARHSPQKWLSMAWSSTSACSACALASWGGGGMGAAAARWAEDAMIVVRRRRAGEGEWASG